MPFDYKQIPGAAAKIAMAYLAAKQAGPQAAAAFLQGIQQGEHQRNTETRQQLLDQSQLQTQEMSRANLKADNDRAAAAQAQQAQQQQYTQGQSALTSIDTYAKSFADPTNPVADPAEAENAVMKRASMLAQMQGKAPDTYTGAVPPMAPVISGKQKKQAQDLYDRAEKMYGPEAMANDQITIKSEQFGDVKPSQLREKFAPQATDQAGQTAKPYVKPTNQINAGSFEDYVIRKYGPNPTADQILEGRKVFNQIDDKAPGGGGSTPPTNDVVESVKGMKDGSLPPILPGRASKDYTALMAEAHRQGYDLAGAATDWMATQKHIATMNGSQQLRLNQAINSLPEMLDSVDALAAKWKGGRFPVLNKANLALAKSGAYGPEVASVANQLDAQIADVTADLGNVYMGGNSPTDHALGLAGKSLSSDWDGKVLKDMTALARKNVQIRKNSINNTGVAGASTDNPYAPPQQAPAPAAGGNDPLGLFK